MAPGSTLSQLVYAEAQSPKQNATLAVFSGPADQDQGPCPVAEDVYTRLLLPPRFYRCCQCTDGFRLDPGKDAWKFPNGLLCSDLKGFFLGGFSVSFINPTKYGHSLK